MFGFDWLSRKSVDVAIFLIGGYMSVNAVLSSMIGEVIGAFNERNPLGPVVHNVEDWFEGLVTIGVTTARNDRTQNHRLTREWARIMLGQETGDRFSDELIELAK